jgi:hypothetical protein
MRALLSAVLLATLVAQAAPALAEFNYLNPAQQKVRRCQDTRKAGDYSTSLQICLSAAATFKQIGDAEKRNPWYSYEVEGMMLEAAALDYAALGRHREALDAAIQAHDLLVYTARTYPMDKGDRADVLGVAARVARIIEAERFRH